jgi:hypothetical protein
MPRSRRVQNGSLRPSSTSAVPAGCAARSSVERGSEASVVPANILQSALQAHCPQRSLRRATTLDPCHRRRLRVVSCGTVDSVEFPLHSGLDCALVREDQDGDLRCDQPTPKPIAALTRGSARLSVATRGAKLPHSSSATGTAVGGIEGALEPLLQQPGGRCPLLPGLREQPARPAAVRREVGPRDTLRSGPRT